MEVDAEQIFDLKLIIGRQLYIIELYENGVNFIFLYWSIFLVLMAFSFLEISYKINIKVKQIIIWLFTVLFIVLSTFRTGVSGDRLTYKAYFESLQGLNGSNIFSGSFEPLYVILNMAVRLFTSNYFVFQFIEAIIVILCFRKVIVNGISESQKYEYSLTMLFIIWALKFGNIYIIRSTIAISFIIYSFQFIVKKDFKKFLVYTLIACGFHMLSVVWLFAYFIYYLKIKKQIYVLVGICVLFSKQIINFFVKFVYSSNVRLFIRIRSYLNRGTEEMYGLTYSHFEYVLKGSLNMVFLLLLFIFIIKKARVSKNDVEILVGYNKLYIIGCLIYFFSMFMSQALGRAAQPYNSVQYLILPYLFSCFDKKTNKMIVFIPFAVYLASRFLVTINSGYDISFYSIFK